MSLAKECYDLAMNKDYQKEINEYMAYIKWVAQKGDLQIILYPRNERLCEILCEKLIEEEFDVSKEKDGGLSLLVSWANKK